MLDFLLQNLNTLHQFRVRSLLLTFYWKRLWWGLKNLLQRNNRSIVLKIYVEKIKICFKAIMSKSIKKTTITSTCSAPIGSERSIFETSIVSFLLIELSRLSCRFSRSDSAWFIRSWIFSFLFLHLILNQPLVSGSRPRAAGSVSQTLIVWGHIQIAPDFLPLRKPDDFHVSFAPIH